MGTLAKFALFFDTRREKKDGTFPLKVRITHEYQQRYYPTRFFLTAEEYAQLTGPRPRGALKETKMEIEGLELQVRSILAKLGNAFTFPAFEAAFLGKKARKAQKVPDLFAYMEGQHDRLRTEGCYSTSGNYKDALTSLRKYWDKKLLEFERVDKDFLNAYERWMLDQGRSISTVGIYLRTVRACFNLAISEGLAKPEQYPFGKKKYQIPAARNVKKALTVEQVGLLVNHPLPERSSGAYFRDLWVFSYLCNGMNVMDIARLRYRDLDGDRIVFTRKKTARSTRGDLKPIIAIVTPEINAIIEKWGQGPALPDTYIFPILSADTPPERVKPVVAQTVKLINKYIRQVAKEVGINKNITTYTARHSYATVLKRAGAPIEFISEALGHADLRTTESYLDSFGDDMKRDFAAKLTDFGGKDKG